MFNKVVASSRGVHIATTILTSRCCWLDSLHRPYNLAPLPSLRKLLKIGPGVSMAAKSTGKHSHRLAAGTMPGGLNAAAESATGAANTEPLPKIELTMYLAEADSSEASLSLL